MLQHVCVWQHCWKLSSRHCRLGARSSALSITGPPNDALDRIQKILFLRVKCRKKKSATSKCFQIGPCESMPVFLCKLKKEEQMGSLGWINKQSIKCIFKCSFPPVELCSSCVKFTMRNYLTWALNLITIAVHFNGILWWLGSSVLVTGDSERHLLPFSWKISGIKCSVLPPKMVAVYYISSVRPLYSMQAWP